MALGMLAALVLSAVTANAGELTLCTGAKDGPYYQAGRQIAKHSEGLGTRIKVVESRGTWDNIQRSIAADGDCDAFIGQPDGHAVLARKDKHQANNLRKVATLHREYLHVLCNAKSGIDSLDDLENDPVGRGYTLAVGEAGSGSWLIWENFQAEDSDYAKVPTANEGGIFALSGVASGVYSCMLVPAGLRNSTVVAADTDYAGDLALVTASDGDFNDAKDPRGEKLYDFTYIPSGTYSNSLQTGLFGSAVETVSWQAGVYVNTQRIAEKQDLANFMQAANRAKAGIRAQFGE